MWQESIYKGNFNCVGKSVYCSNQDSSIAIYLDGLRQKYLFWRSLSSDCYLTHLTWLRFGL